MKPDREPELTVTGDMRSPEPTFHERWYGNSELELLARAARSVLPLVGEIIEFGCWEGRSTATIARACAPEPVTAVDTWEGSTSEGAGHVTVVRARERDVFATFRENMRRFGLTNVVARREDVLAFLRATTGPIKFCHIDAAHDYASVRASLELLLPRLVPGAVLIGHDYEEAHAGRGDLGGGVERAVREVLPYHGHRGNNWWYVHNTDPQTWLTDWPPSGPSSEN